MRKKKFIYIETSFFGDVNVSMVIKHRHINKFVLYTTHKRVYVEQLINNQFHHGIASILQKSEWQKKK